MIFRLMGTIALCRGNSKATYIELYTNMAKAQYGCSKKEAELKNLLG